MASILIIYGIVVLTPSLFVQKTPDGSVFITGVVLGALCVLWGFVGFAGNRKRVGAILTVMASAFTGLFHAVPAWLAAVEDGSASTFTLLVTVLFFVSIGMLLYLFHGERPPEFYNSPHNQKDVRS